MTSNEQITATTTATAWTVSQASGEAKTSFVAAAEEIVPAGQTKTYELRGTILTGGMTGDILATKIDSATTTAITSTYASVAGISTASFVWTDRSGAGGTHSAGSTDWTADYKVPGIPTSPLSLSK
jgi:hypothetical protein